MSLHVLIVYDRADLRKNRFFAHALRCRAQSHGLTAQVITSEVLQHGGDLLRPPFSSTSQSATVVISRSRDLELRQFLESQGLPVISPSAVLAVANDKVETERFAQRIGVPHLPIYADLALEEPPTDFPFVLKDRFGHGGSSVKFIASREDYRRTLTESPEVAWIGQPYLPTATVEVRSYILGQQRRWTVRKESTNGLQSNISYGASTQLSTLDADSAKVVEACLSELPNGLYGVDIVWDGLGRPLLHEIEDPVGTRALYRHGIDAAAAVIDYVTKLYAAT